MVSAKHPISLRVFLCPGLQCECTLQVVSAGCVRIVVKGGGRAGVECSKACVAWSQGCCEGFCWYTRSRGDKRFFHVWFCRYVSRPVSANGVISQSCHDRIQCAPYSTVYGRHMATAAKPCLYARVCWSLRCTAKRSMHGSRMSD